MAICLVASLLVSPASSATWTPLAITNCADDTQPGVVISAPGRYALTRAVRDCDASAAIQIASDDVILNLRGLLVDGVADSGFGILLVGSPTGVVVRNGTLSDFSIGLSIGGAGNAAKRLVLRSNRIGISSALGSSATSLLGNTVVDSVETGVVMSSGTSDHRLMGNTVARNGIRGISSTGGSRLRFEDNLVAGNDDDGLAVVQSGADNLFIGNRIYGNAGAGIYTQPNVVSRSTVRGNTVIGNDGRGIDVGSSSRVVRNRVQANGNEGIAAADASTRIMRNVVTGNLRNGIFVDTPNASTRIARNRTIGNGLKGIDAAPFGGSGAGTNRARANGTGNVGIGTGPFECNPTDLCDLITPRSIRRGNASFVDVDCGGSPGVVIDTPGSYVLDRAETGCPADPAIVIDADDVTLDLGHAVLDSTGGGGIRGIRTLPGRAGVTIKRGGLSDYEYGIEMDATASEIRGILARSNGTAGIDAGASNTVRDSVITRTTNYGLLSGSGSTVEDSIAAGNNSGGGGGAIDANGTGSILRGNLVVGNSRSGIVGGSETTATGNTSVGNGWIGIDVNGDSAVTSNRSIGNGGRGIRAFNFDSTVRANRVLSNGGDPTFGDDGIWASNNGNRIIENVVKANLGNGIFIETPNATTVIRKNKAVGNGVLGIDAEPFTGGGLGSNIAKRNGDAAECNPAALC